MIAAIILASGMSKRLGRNKLLLPLGNKRVIEHVIDNVKSSRIKDIYLVYGKDHQEELKKPRINVLILYIMKNTT